jgi:hypothetical protein
MILVATISFVAAPAEAMPDDVIAGIDPAAIAMPGLSFTPTPGIEADYDKYFYFTRPDTGFSTALADIRQCDGFARGLLNMFAQNGTVVGRGLAGTFAAAVLGPGEMHKVRRANMRRCMHYKGYQRFGLKKDLWLAFNFEEGGSPIPEAERDRYLAQQAKVASEAHVQQKDLGL